MAGGRSSNNQGNTAAAGGDISGGDGGVMAGDINVLMYRLT